MIGGPRVHNVISELSAYFRDDINFIRTATDTFVSLFWYTSRLFILTSSQPHPYLATLFPLAPDLTRLAVGRLR